MPRQGLILIDTAAKCRRCSDHTEMFGPDTGTRGRVLMIHVVVAAAPSFRAVYGFGPGEMFKEGFGRTFRAATSRRRWRLSLRISGRCQIPRRRRRRFGELARPLR